MFDSSKFSRATKTQQKYLKSYAEKDISALESFPQSYIYEHVIVVPAFQESANFIDRFAQSVLASQCCIFIVVINEPDNDFGRQHHQQQLDLANRITQMGNMVWQKANFKLIALEQTLSCKDGHSAILLVDRYSVPIEAEYGVGLARKIGADIACYLHASEQINSSWIHSSDADAHLPDNYLLAHQAIKNTSKNRHIAATCCNFFHYSDEKSVHDANKLYENSLKYYVAGLTYAGSSYGYFTIGSTLSFDVESYCKARGFPKRSAGEDFYLLNKLAKLGGVEFLPEVKIQLDARPSERVPFGTGPAVKRIMALNDEDEFAYYHPQVFIELKLFLQATNCLWQNREHVTLWLATLSAQSQLALKSVGLLSFIEKQKHATEQQFNKQLIVWFDSFKTLKFIHALRDAGLKNIPFSRALTEAPFIIDASDDG